MALPARRGKKPRPQGRPGAAGAGKWSDLPTVVEGPGFFDDYPHFEATSRVASDLQRLNFRYRHVIERNRALLEGKRVLDVASHDSRFTFAALVGAGAAHVTGIEARESLVANGVETLRRYGLSPDRFRLVHGDVFEKIHEIAPGSIDTAMVLGFLYHTARQYELIAAIARIGAQAIIVDSKVLPGRERPVILLEWESTGGDAKIWDASRQKVLSSVPSQLALEMILQEFGYETEVLVPETTIPRSAHQYKSGVRVTIVGRRN